MEARPQFVNGVRSVIQFLDAKIPVPSDRTALNPFHGKGCHLLKGDMRTRMPWVFLDQVASGHSGPVGFSVQQGYVGRSYDKHLEDWIAHNWSAFH